MSLHEIFDRTRQTTTCRIDEWRQHRGHDFAADVRVTTSTRYGNFFFDQAQLREICTLLNQRFPTTSREIVRRAEENLLHHFDLLGYRNLDYGAEIDWHLDLVHGKRAPRKAWFKMRYLDFEEVGDSKITWELNRHQHLVTLAKAYRITEDERFAHEITHQWKHWHRENPYPVGINWASSLEVAFRTLSWIWVYFLLLNTPAMTAELRVELLKAFAVSGRHIETYLSTYFSPNTHLLGEAVALLALGTLFPDLSHAARWKSRGWEIVRESATEQVGADGFYFEQSTYYHVYALDMFLHARILAANNGITVPAEFDGILTKMLDVLCVLSRAGVPPMIGDDDGGRLFDGRRNRAEHLLDPLSTGAVLFHRGDFKFFVGALREETLWLLSSKGLDEFEALKTSDPTTESVGLRDSGLYLMADVDTGQQLFIDAGPHGPGHGHADALSVQLIRDGRTFLRDSGTYEYVGYADERTYYRGTPAHSTLIVDEQDQAESNGPFAWTSAPSAKCEKWVTGPSFNLFIGSHNGYERLADPVIHRRAVFHRKGQFWFVRDNAVGEGEHRLELLWHLGSNLAPESINDNLFADGQDTLGLVTAEGHGWAQSAHRGAWSPVYGSQEKAMILSFARQGTLPMEFATLLVPNVRAKAGPGRLERLAENGAVQGYRYIREKQEHYFFFADRPMEALLGKWKSDARVLYWSVDRDLDERLLVICGGTFAEVGGIRVLAGKRIVDYAELISSGRGTELRSSDPEAITIAASLDRVEMELTGSAVQQGSDV
jgi:heparinase II/III-like protein